MKCNNCGHMLPSDSEFCQYCGAKISGMTAGINRNPVTPSAQRPSNVRENVLSEKKTCTKFSKVFFPVLVYDSYPAYNMLKFKKHIVKDRNFLSYSCCFKYNHLCSNSW